MDLTTKQVLAIIVSILGVIVASTAQLTDLFGPGPTRAIVSIAGLANSVLAAILSIVSSQSGIVRDVQSMPGVESIVVNNQANSTLASLAVDPNQIKILTKPGDEGAVKAAAQTTAS